MKKSAIILVMSFIAATIVIVFCSWPSGVRSASGLNKLQELIEHNSDVVLFVERSAADNKTYAYTISKERCQRLIGKDICAGPVGERVGVDEAIMKCVQYAKQTFGGQNVVLCNAEIRPAYVFTNRVWYVYAYFVGEKVTANQDNLQGCEGGLRVCVLLDGEVVVPRITEYTKLIDTMQ